MSSVAPALQYNEIPLHGRYSVRQALAQFAAVVLVVVIYSYPAIKTRADFGATSLPPEFAPDLSLYLNLSSLRTVSPGQVLNPYYLVSVPANAAAYFKFRLGPALFSSWNELFAGRMWLAMFFWNLFWWGLLCAVALWLFGRFLPIDSPEVGIAGLGLLMLVDIGMAKPLLTAWVHLPSLSGFQSISLQLPFMRAFTPQIPIPLLLGYLGLQMAALREKGFYRWVAMGLLQLVALSAFPYATLMMAGVTFVSVVWWMFSRGLRATLHIPLAYGAGCAIADGIFLMRGSLSINTSHSSPIHFQPHLLPHLVGGTWLLLCLLTIATVLSKNLPAEVKWPLAGLGTTNVVLMLGDAVVPSVVLLLSHHAAYFAHTTAAILFTFLASAALIRIHQHSNKIRVAVAVALGVLALNGILLSLGTYRTFLPLNRQQAEMTRLLSSWPPAEGDLFIARSRDADDTCGWVALIARRPVLFCTDAEVLLTPQQNRDIHRFRQAVYLYLSGVGSDLLQRQLSVPDPSSRMYALGYWAEATSSSVEERNQGLRAIQAELIPQLQRVEEHDPVVEAFFRNFRRIIVIDNQPNHTFSPERLASFLKLEGQQNRQELVLFSYVPR